MRQTSNLTSALAQSQETIFSSSAFDWPTMVDDLYRGVEALLRCVEDATREGNPERARRFEDWAVVSAALLAHIAQRMAR